MRPQKGKQKIFSSAMELFEKQGYFATTIEQITAHAGVSKGLVYNYFNSKEALLIGLIDDMTAKMETVAQTLNTKSSDADSLTFFIDTFFHFLKSEKQFLKLQLTLLIMPDLQKVVGPSQRRRAIMLLGTVTLWFEQKDVENPKDKARLFLAMMDGIALHYLVIYARYPLIKMKTEILQTVDVLCKSPTKER